MNRNKLLQNLQKEPFDIIIIGGGATGLGAGVDAALRGFQVLLLEQSDFGKATSSRSTKLMHGGLRYLKQGHIPLVKEALKERGLILKNAPHLVHPLGFIIPNYRWIDQYFYQIGLKVYDLLAGSLNLFPSKGLSRKKTISYSPTLESKDLKGSVLYSDGQFDDTRLLITLAKTFEQLGGTPLNYFQVTELLKKEEHICGVSAIDQESNIEYRLHAKVVINATGIFSDEIRKLDDHKAKKIVRPSQGVHIVVNQSFLPSEHALIVPKTDDGRIIFIIPWHQHTLIGTTDTSVNHPVLEPIAQEDDVQFLLRHASRYLSKKIEREDILSIFAGLRPLVTSGTKSTSKLSRTHTIRTSSSNLISIAGGKWTTFRKMAEDVINQAITIGKLNPSPSKTHDYPLHGYLENAQGYLERTYGSEAVKLKQLIQKNPAQKERLDPELFYIKAEVLWAIQKEMARTVEDILCRRTRALFLNVKAALRMAPYVASILAKELQKDADWEKNQIENFIKLSKNYL